MVDKKPDSISLHLSRRRGAWEPPTERIVAANLGRIKRAGEKAGVEVAVRELGRSREGRGVYGALLGDGETAVSITAGAHADEPGGPLAALAIAEWLVSTEDGRGLLRKTRWRIGPHVNPDGAERNAAWFSDPPDLARYLAGVVREGPPDDVEFHYAMPGGESAQAGANASSGESMEPTAGTGGGPDTPRPENLAVSRFLSEGAPYALHASLHGMAFGEGAWWLIGRDWADRTGELRRALAALFQELGLGLHEIDRKGEKGFWRIERGFSTTPTGVAMREYFTGRGEQETARHFLASSMEYVQSLGGDPLVMVSEIPLFLIGGRVGTVGGRREETPAMRLRRNLEAAPLAARKRGTEAASALASEFDIRPVPFAVQIEAIGRGILTAVNWHLSQGHEARLRR